MVKYVRLFILILLGAACIGLQAQTITVSGTVTDTDGQSWNNGSWSAVLYSPNGVSYYLGTSVPTATFSGMLSGAGALISSGQFYNTNTITPSGAMYTITVCSNTSAPCSTFNTPTTGGAQVISAINSLIQAPRFPVSLTAHGYLDVEVITTPYPGGDYFNVTSLSNRGWNGTAWQSASAGPATITGGTIDNTVIGGTTPAAGTFTTLNATSINGVVGAEQVVTFSATPAFNATNPSSIITITSNVTSWTIASGLYGSQQKTITWCESAAGGFTVAGTPANVRGAFNPFPATTASTCSTQAYKWTPSLATPVWLAVSAGSVNQ